MSNVFDAALGKTVEKGEQTGEYLQYDADGEGGSVLMCYEPGQDPALVQNCELWCDIRESRHNWTEDQRCNCSHFACDGCQNRQQCNRGCDD